MQSGISLALGGISIKEDSEGNGSDEYEKDDDSGSDQ